MLKFLVMILMSISSMAFADCRMTFSESNRCEGAGYEHSRLMKKVISDLQSVYGYKLVPGAAGTADFHFNIDTTVKGKKNTHSSGATYNLSSLVKLFKITDSSPRFEEQYKNGASVAFGIAFTSNPKIYDEMLALTQKALVNFPHCQN